MATQRRTSSTALTLIVVFGAILGGQALTNFTLPPLDYPYSGLEPYIDTETMTLHHSRHHKAAIDSLNTALLAAPAPVQAYTLTQLLVNAGSFGTPEALTRSIRNGAGGHFNHAFFWKVMRPTWYDQIPSIPKNRRSPALDFAITKSFGSYDAFAKAFTEAAVKVFGSGWTWLCYKPGGAVPLAIVSTPNQDNPLMKAFVKPEDQCTPILGIDMFEHAYYLKHRNLRADYLTEFWSVIDWTRVSKNLVWATQGTLEALWK